jgi:hypothetical protein
MTVVWIDMDYFVANALRNDVAIVTPCAGIGAQELIYGSRGQATE